MILIPVPAISSSGDGDPTADVEYTFYGLLALGVLASCCCYWSLSEIKGLKWRKEASHTCGLVQIEKRGTTTLVVWFKSEKGGQPHSWSGPKWKKEANHARG